ncbi:MAG: Xaa-Pro aminopeptidase [Gammaproteobacteria bacterium]
MALTLKEFERRRRRLMEHMEADSIAVLPAAPMRLRNRDTEYPYRQESDFLYLSGFTEPDAVLVLVPGRAQGEAIMFCAERDAEKERWTGPQLGPERAVQMLHVDDAFPVSDMDEILPGLLEGRQRLYYTMGANAEFDRHVMEWVNMLRARKTKGAEPPEEFVDLGHLLHDLRLIKSAAEQRIMRRAGEITAFAHRVAMAKVHPGMNEQALEAELLYEFMRQGARYPAYPCIVGGGGNACIMHYTANNALLRDGDLVLVDAGCELEHYAADLTRTYPINGKFSGPQRELYEVVLRAQKCAIEAVRPGAHFNAPHEAAVAILVEGLIALGIMQGDANTILEDESYRRYSVHKSSHWIGLDVHDVGDYRIEGEWREIEPGMVLTVEPGLYIGPDAVDAPEPLRGLGVRVEDDVLVTRDGHEVLTAEAPKEIADIEAEMSDG